MSARADDDSSVESETPSAEEYRAMAAHCRDLARGTASLSADARGHLLRMAERFEESAGKREAEGG